MAISARTRARRLTVQALYQWQMAGQELADIERQFLEEQDLRNTEVGYFQTLLHEIPRHVNEVDDFLRPCLDRSLEAVDPVELAILRLGAFELRYRQDVPYKVVINEAVELAKRYGAADGHAFVNGILDRMAPELRAIEIGDRPAAAPVKPKTAPVAEKTTVKITHKPRAEPTERRPAANVYKGSTNGRGAGEGRAEGPWAERTKPEPERARDTGTPAERPQGGVWPERPKGEAESSQGDDNKADGIWPSSPPGGRPRRS